MINVIVVKEGLVDENILCKDLDEAKEVIQKFDNMLDKNSPGIDEIISRGFTWVTGGAICISVPETVGKFSEICQAASSNSKELDTEQSDPSPH